MTSFYKHHTMWDMCGNNPFDFWFGCTWREYVDELIAIFIVVFIAVVVVVLNNLLHGCEIRRIEIRHQEEHERIIAELLDILDGPTNPNGILRSPEIQALLNNNMNNMNNMNNNMNNMDNNMGNNMDNNNMNNRENENNSE